MINQLLADFIQINKNIRNSNVWGNDLMLESYPFKNSFDEVISNMYDWRNEDEPFCKPSITKTTYDTLEEIAEAIEDAINVLRELERITGNSIYANYIKIYIDWTNKIFDRLLVSKEDERTIFGIMTCYGKDDFGYWSGFSLTPEEENVIMEILMKHDTEGCSVRGTWKAVLEDIL